MKRRTATGTLKRVCSSSKLWATLTSVIYTLILFSTTNTYSQNKVESLNRGIIAVRTSSNEVFVSWRMLGTDPTDIAFNLYRGGTLLNNSPITQSTNYIDSTASNGHYTVLPVIAGVEQPAFGSTSVWEQPYHTLNLQRPAGGTTPSGGTYTYSPNDCSVGDLDGDGDYEIIVKWDPSNSKDNSQSGYTGNVFIDAYTLEGTLLWRIDLGRNIRAGAHYTHFMVYDLDSDGKAELACKTADATIDAEGTVIGDINADYRNSNGYILSGPEYLTVFNGETGAAMATTNYVPARGSVSSWGDNYGNRVDRFLAGVAYLDGNKPSLVMCRGYYTRTVLAAWDWRSEQLTQRWVFDSDTPGNEGYAGQGAHSLITGDVDGDGKDEIVYGAATIDDDGTGFYTTGLGHGDAEHMSDIDPNRPGLEIFMVHESPSQYGEHGIELHDAATGEIIWSRPGEGGDIGRGVAMDIDPTHLGYEAWASRGGLNAADGTQISTSRPGQMNFASWWDGDLLRELLDGTTISKWDYTNFTSSPLLSGSTYGAASNNSTKATPNLSADILGDWREEVIWRHQDNDKLLIFTTTIPTSNKIYTLMHDPQYRTAIAWQNTGYNQPPHPGFFLGDGMNPAPTPNIELVAEITPPALINLDAIGRKGAVDINWKLSGVSASQDLYRDTDPNPSGRVRIAKLDASTNTFTDDSVANGTTYYYWIKSYDADGNTVNSNAANATPDVTSVILEAVEGDSLVNLNWIISGVNGSLEIYRDGDDDPSGRVRIASLESHERSYTDSGIANDSTYYYWIKTTDGSDSTINSNVASATPTKPEEPVLVQENQLGFCSIEGTIDSNNAGYTGDGFANTDNTLGKGIEWRISVDTSDDYEILFRYANGSSDRPGDLIIDGVNMGNVGLPPTGGWTSWSTASLTVALESGEHDIRLEATTSSGLANVDYLGVRGQKGTSPSAAECVYSPSIILEAVASADSVKLDWVIENAVFIRQEVYRDTDADPNGRARIGSLGATETTFTDTNIETDSTYYYWIKGTYDDGSSISSDAVGATIPQPVPGITLTADGSEVEVALSWEIKNTSFRHQEIFRDGDSNPSGRSRIASISATDTTYIDTSIVADSTYFYWIKGIYDDGSNINSNSAQASTASVPIVPAIVLEANATDVAIQLSWEIKNTSFRHQEIFRDTDSNPSGRTHIGSLGATDTTFTDSDLEAGITYYYWIKGVYNDGSNINSNVGQATAPEEILVPAITLVGEGNYGYAALNWTIENTSFHHQEIFRDGDSNPSGRSRIASISATDTTYIDTNIVADSTYFYWIKGIYDDGSSINSEGIGVVIPPTPSITLTAVANDATISLDWIVENITFSNQEIYRSTNSDSTSSELIASVANSITTFTDSTAEAGNTYYYWVKGIDDNGFSVISSATEAFLDYQILTVKIQEDEAGFCDIDGTVHSYISGYTGTGYTNTYFRRGVSIYWAVNAPMEGSYEFTIRYHNGLLYRKNARLSINDEVVINNLKMKAKPNRFQWNTISFTVDLGEGVNNIKLTSLTFKGLPYIDYLEVTGLGISAGNCNDESAQRQGRSLVINNIEENLQTELMVYPNPVLSNQININSFFFNASEAKVAIVNSVGQLVYAKELGFLQEGELNYTLDIPELSKGTYILQLHYTGGVQTVNFIKR
ncbi:carbohydrate-binding protein [Flammeovirgaceae bacterium SG7u.111]|nr:carbohydrate-binding protein [Flammeovirgaceae bacterium SG7u.132]WPO36914.1 carbohydrate-binding protein [Flammeovirgaceae bacterium SG7u.111]